MTICAQQAAWGRNYFAGYDAFVIREDDFISVGIRWFEHWEPAIGGWPMPSHALKIIGANSTVEALSDGVVYGSLFPYLADPKIKLLVRRPYAYTPELGAYLSEVIQTMVGRKYNYPLIGAMAATNTVTGHLIDRLSGGRFSKWLDGLAHDKQKAICSECVAEANQSSPVLANRGVLARPGYTIKPADLFVDPEVYEPSDYALCLTA